MLSSTKSLTLQKGRQGQVNRATSVLLKWSHIYWYRELFQVRSRYSETIGMRTSFLRSRPDKHKIHSIAKQESMHHSEVQVLKSKLKRERGRPRSASRASAPTDGDLLTNATGKPSLKSSELASEARRECRYSALYCPYFFFQVKVHNLQLSLAVQKPKG